MLFSVSEAGLLLGVHPATIRRWDKGGKIKCSRTIGNHRRISKEEIDRIIAGKKRRYTKRNRGVVILAFLLMIRRRETSKDSKK